MDPTQAQLANRLSPQATNIYLPMQDGVFTNGYDQMFIRRGNEVLQFSLVDNLIPQSDLAKYGNYGGQMSAAKQMLQQQYGIDFNSLPAVNWGDFWQAASSEGVRFPARNVDISEFLKTPPANLQTHVINAGPNQLAPGVSQGTPPAQTAPLGQASSGNLTLAGGGITQTAGGAPQVNLQPGDTGDQVRQLQDFLVSYGFMTRDQVNTGYGIYGPQTTAAVTQLQQALGVDNSSGPGFWGPRTMGAVQQVVGGQDAAQQPAGVTGGGGASQTTQGGGQPTGSAYDTSSMNPAGTPYFMGRYSLVRFSGQGPTGYMNESVVWLVDTQSKTLRPFANASAVENFFEYPVDMSQIQVMSAASLLPGGTLGSQDGEPGYELLGNEYMVQADGTARELEFSASHLAARYGSPINQTAEQWAGMLVQGFLKHLTRSDSGISKQTIDALDDAHKAYYISAIAYGGYAAPDIYRDLKARELGLTDVRPLSATMTRSQYQATDEGRFAYSDSRTTPPPQIGDVSMASLNLALDDIPAEAFQTLIPVLDFNSEEFKQKMNDIETAYYDILLQQVQAGTEQEKAVADYNWEKFRQDLERTYGIQLSNNALDAWNQIQQAYDQFAQRGISGSGIQDESIDSFLRRVRQRDTNMRSERVSKEEEQMMQYYTQYATPEQIRALVDEDQAKGLSRDQWRATRWGLVPSDEIKNELSLANLKEKYPNTSEDVLMRYVTSILDEHGNYRSGVFSRNAAARLDIETQKRNYQRTMALDKSLREEEKAYKQFTTPDSPFLRSDSNIPPSLYTPERTGTGNTYVNLQDAIRSAGRHIPLDRNDPGVQSVLSGINTATRQLAQLRDKFQAPQDTTPFYKPSEGSPGKAPSPGSAYQAPKVPAGLLSSPDTQSSSPSIQSFIRSPQQSGGGMRQSTPATSTASVSSTGGFTQGLKNLWGRLGSLFGPR